MTQVTDRLAVRLSRVHNREDYLFWVGLWRRTYADITKSIRDMKPKRSPRRDNNWELFTHHCRAVGSEATHMLMLREASKHLSMRQRLQAPKPDPEMSEGAIPS